MPDRPRRRFEFEWLEPRVYLSAAQATSLAALSLAGDGAPAITNDAAETSSLLDLGNGSAPAIFFDLNGNDDSGDGLLVTLDAATGRLIDAVRISEGRVVFVNDLVIFATPAVEGSTATSPIGMSSSLDDLLRARRDTDGLTESLAASISRVVYVEQSGSDNDRFPIQTFGSLANTFSQALSDARVVVEAVQPVFVLLPTTVIPSNLSVRDSDPDAGNEPPATSPSNQPVVIRPPFTGWLGRLSGSPWWSRTVQLPAVQSQISELIYGGPSASGLDGGLQAEDLSNSRVFLNSPTRLMAFTKPASLPTTGGLGGELVIYSFSTGQLTRTGHTVSGSLLSSDGVVAFLSLDEFAGAGLQGDGPVPATVLKVYDPATGGVRITGVKADAIRVQAGKLVVGVRELNAASIGVRTGRLQAYKFDTATGRLINLQTAFDPAPVASTPKNDAPAATESAGATTSPRGVRPNDMPRRPGTDSIQVAVPVERSATPMPPANNVSLTSFETPIAGPPTPDNSPASPPAAPTNATATSGSITGAASNAGGAESSGGSE